MILYNGDIVRPDRLMYTELLKRLTPQTIKGGNKKNSQTAHSTRNITAILNYKTKSFVNHTSLDLHNHYYLTSAAKIFTANPSPLLNGPATLCPIYVGPSTVVCVSRFRLFSSYLGGWGRSL